jgi:hypothetical protein
MLFELLDLLDVHNKKEAFLLTRLERQIPVEKYQQLVQEAETKIQWYIFQRFHMTEEQEKFRGEILNLVRGAFYTRYGRYFAAVCDYFEIPE